MIRKTISMANEMETWVSNRITSGQYNNDSEYFCDLVRRDQENENAQKQLKALLNGAENSGISQRSINDIWEDAEQKYQQNHG